MWKTFFSKTQLQQLILWKDEQTTSKENRNSRCDHPSYTWFREKKYKQKQTNKTLFSNHCFFLLLTTECHSCQMNHVNSRWFTNFITAILHIPKQCTGDDPCHYWQVILLTACSWLIPPPPPIHCIGCDDLCQDIYQQRMYHLPPSNQQIVPPPPPPP